MRAGLFLAIFLLAGCTTSESLDSVPVATPVPEEPVAEEAPVEAPPEPQSPPEQDPEKPPEEQEEEEPDEAEEPEEAEEPAPEENVSDDPPAPPAPTHPDWGSPDGKGIRPGINTAFEGAGCTSSFLFHLDYERYFLASAAHCVARGGNTDTDGCTAPTAEVGSPVELRRDTAGTAYGSIAYSSWVTMQRAGESDGAACGGNDFALLEIPPNELADVHPASLHFEAPTGLATSATGTVWGYGASSLKFGVSTVHPKQGLHLGTGNGGWSHLVYLATPGIPGDSGGHIMTDDGQALGVASTIILTPYPAANHYTDIAKSLAYMQQYEGWAPEIVTWDGFNASLV